MELPDDDVAEAARHLSRLTMLAMIGQRVMENESGSDDGEDLDLVYDLAWAAAIYAHRAAAVRKNAEPSVTAPTTTGHVIPFHPGVAP